MSPRKGLARDFIVQRRVGSRRSAQQCKITIGRYPEISLVQARKMALDAIAKMQFGNDIIKEERDRIEAEEAAKEAELTVAELCDRWLETDAKRSRMRGPRFGTLRSEANLKYSISQVERYIKPTIGHIKINDWYKGLPKIWAEVRKRTGLHDVRIHDLRHNFAGILASNGASLPMIGAILGHTQAETTARYAHLTNHTLVGLAEQAAELLKERSFDR